MTLSRPQRRLAAAGAAAALVTAAAFVAPYLLPADPNATDLSRALLPPLSQESLLGTDSVGRDVLLRTLAGGHESLLSAFAVIAASYGVGVVVGLAAGFCGGAAGAVLDKVITSFQAFPSFVLAVAVSALLGQGTGNMVLAISLAYWTQPARLARSMALKLRSSDAVRAARVCGARGRHICAKYLLPALAGPLAVQAALAVGDVVLTMAGLSFLGLGPARPTNEWGAIMADARSTFQIAPWCIVVPGVALLVVVTVFNLLGDSLRDVLEARGAQTEPPERRRGRRRQMPRGLPRGMRRAPGRASGGAAASAGLRGEEAT